MLEKYNEIWDRISNTIKKGFDSEPVYNEKYLKTKVKSYKGKIRKDTIILECFRRMKICSQRKKDSKRYYCRHRNFF